MLFFKRFKFHYLPRFLSLNRDAPSDTYKCTVPREADENHRYGAHPTPRGQRFPVEANKP